MLNNAKCFEPGHPGSLNKAVKNQVFPWGKIPFIVKNILTISALISLIVLPFQKENEDYKSDLTKAGIFSLVVLLSSDLIERLSQLRVGKTGIELQLGKLQSNVQANRSANQRESQALGFLGFILLNDNAQAREQFFNILLQDGEVKTLESLFEAEKNQTELPYEKSEVFEQHLRHLQVLDFIEPRLTTENIEISSMPKRDDLRRYFQISKMGRLCLALSSNSQQVRPDEIAPECKKLLAQLTLGKMSDKVGLNESQAEISKELAATSINCNNSHLLYRGN